MENKLENILLRDLMYSSRSTLSCQGNYPTEVTTKDIDVFIETMETIEIKTFKCSCGRSYFSNGYGFALMECDECYFSRWPEEERQKFFRSFFE